MTNNNQFKSAVFRHECAEKAYEKALKAHENGQIDSAALFDARAKWCEEEALYTKSFLQERGQGRYA